MRKVWLVAGLLVQTGLAAASPGLVVSPNETLEMQGLSVIVDQMHFHPIFRDEKNAGIQIILHGDRIATDGALRLNPTPEQWDPVPAFVKRERGDNQLIVTSTYSEPLSFGYRTIVTPEGNGFRVSIDLDQPLPASLVGKAGFNLDFLPTSYFGKSYLLGHASGLFPRNPEGPMAKDGSGDPLPLASGADSITVSPEDPLTRVTIKSDSGPIALYDARNRAQNGWFVARTLIPAGKTKDALVWHIRPNVIKNWVRDPVVSFNQAGYTPDRAKVAIVELDPHMKAPKAIKLLKIDSEGGSKVALEGTIEPWGRWTRYDYARFDFSSVQEPGVYAISYAGQVFNPFRIAEDAYGHIWQPSLDTYLAEQMDHMAVREEYRTWQGLSHMDDAHQAPPNITHFDGYSMGPNLDSPFAAGQHIPGLNVGGFQDAGDFDIQTADNGWVVQNLVRTRELFGADWDEDTIDEAARSVEIRKPDGVPDVLQHIRHGALQLLAQYKVFGHAIEGIVEPTLKLYTNLGDAGSETDRIPDTADDRWAFTSDVPGNDYNSAAALAAASRVLGELDPDLASQSLAAAKILWANQQNPGDRINRASRGEWTPDNLDMAAVPSTVELVITTKGDPIYTAKLEEFLPQIEKRPILLGNATRAIPYMSAEYRSRLEQIVKAAKPVLDAELAKTPFGVPVALGTWAGSGEVAEFGADMYLLHKAFPQIIGPDYTIAAIDYILGRHPATNLSLVSTVGTRSKLVAYTHNRADYSFVPGAMVPGVLVIKPDFPEQKTEWPFLWFENEATVSSTSAYILAANAMIAVTKEK